MYRLGPHSNTGTWVQHGVLASSDLLACQPGARSTKIPQPQYAGNIQSNRRVHQPRLLDDRKPPCKSAAMFGAFRFTNSLSSGLLWKTPWRLSKFQKRRQRLRLRAVDSVVATVDSALAKQGVTTSSVERWKAEMPKEEEMRAKDKYTIFDRKEKRYRKGIHSRSSLWRGSDWALACSNGTSVMEFVVWLT
jgi:hypothetical protein